MDQIDSLQEFLPLIECENLIHDAVRGASLVAQAIQPHHITIIVSEAVLPFVEVSGKI
jgi:hypothetical protein